MKDKKLAIVFWVLSLALLISLVITLIQVSEGINISGIVLGGFIIIGIIVGCLIFSGILMRSFFIKTSYWKILFIATTISFIALHFQLYFWYIIKLIDPHLQISFLCKKEQVGIPLTIWIWPNYKKMQRWSKSV